MQRNKTLTSLDEHIDRNNGKLGTPEREEFERGFAWFKLGVEIKAAREQKGLTQRQLAENIGVNRTHISPAENDIKSVSVSKLRKIVETGLGGEMKLTMKF